jgi:general secretion pathway protein G
MRFTLRKSEAFTLIELLTVIAILALLAAIVFPVYSQARKKAQQTPCLSNVKQLGIAMLLYAQDFDEKFAWGCDITDREPESWSDSPYNQAVKTMPLLPDLLFPYTNNRQVWRCPADFGYTVTGMWLGVALDGRPNAFEKFGMSYHYHTTLTLTQQTVHGVTARDPENPSLTHGASGIPMLWDASGEWHGGALRSDYRYSIVFCDGHAKSLLRPQAEMFWLRQIGR